MTKHRFQPSSAGRGTIVGFLYDLATFGWKQLLRDQAPLMSAALAYRTIFSLIPVLVLSLVLFKAFLGEEGMKNALGQLFEYTGIDKIEFIRPASGDPARTATVQPPDAPLPVGERAGADSGASLTKTVHEFIEKTVAHVQGINFGLITVVGVLVLIYAALSLVIQVEQSFNTICRAPTGRSIRSRLTSYFTLLMLGPVLLIGGFFLTRDATKWVSEVSPWISTPISVVSRVGITWILLVMAYSWMPNARVRLNAAAIGALLAAILWEGAKSLLTNFVAYLASPETGGQTAVYGSLALLPIFLMWVYFTWLIVLFGLEVAFAVQTVASGHHIHFERQESQTIIDASVGVVLMQAASENFKDGKPCTTEELAQRTGLSELITERILQHLVIKGYLHRVDLPSDADIDAYVLARPPDTISAGEILSAMHALAGELPAPKSATSNGDASILSLLRRSQIEALSTLKLTSLKGEEQGSGV